MTGRRDRPRHHPARLRQVLHVLRRALHARARARRGAARDPAPGARAGRRPASRRCSCSARPSTRTATRTSGSPSCCARSPPSTASSACASRRPTRSISADDVIAAIAETPKICKHVHLPLQSASDSGAGAHAPRLRLRDVPRAVATSCARCPAIAITTDLLIGFCDETEDEFRATLRAQEELRFDSAFTFAYSEREGTYAARKMPDTVPAERQAAPAGGGDRACSSGSRREIMAAQVGKRERILIEQRSKRSADELMGRTDAFRTVHRPGARPGIVPGALVDVTIVRATRATLFGSLASERLNDRCRVSLARDEWLRGFEAGARGARGRRRIVRRQVGARQDG